MRRRRPPKADDYDYRLTPAGVSLAGQYGYPEAAKAHAQGNGADIRRAYQSSFAPLLRRDRLR
jgi:hypothetical protein